ncbi:Pre-mRNA-splicing factor cwf23 [Daldinia childiae]|uniref:Pre-mRNA-splicing factor cwf23 n=1 Tax=Daldinia childiae TaxID=326645 RepID=UPI00144633E5|nr:Pre-mRNA-splicing factor cwf23 [Daldinia childiae]KAF3059956.1 Pre-mRNA-splicing factor cwf23 [Daldinia childiae]
MDKSDLLLYAKEYATTQDLYELLGITSDTPKEDIHRAWRKRSLKYHPDKAGANFDPAKWELFERARDVLSDAPARDVYDSQRSAALLREQQRRAMDSKRRAMVEDLEARERGAIKRPRGEGDGPTMSEAERRRLVEAGKRRLEERQRLMREAEERERQREKEQVVQESKENLKRSKPPNSDEQRGRRKTPDTSSTVESKMDIDPEPPAKNGDGYDDQIADLERRLEGARQRKAAKKEKKAGWKNGDEKLKTHENTPIPNASQGPQADEKKGTSTSGTANTFSFSASTGTSTSPNGNATTSSKPRAKGDFASTMARLRAAQAEKEARKKAEEASAASVAADGVGI